MVLKGSDNYDKLCDVFNALTFQGISSLICYQEETICHKQGVTVQISAYQPTSYTVRQSTAVIAVSNFVLFNYKVTV